MNLAKPAPKVGQATSSSAPRTEAATAEAARPTGAPKVDSVEPVEPAIPVAPENVQLITTTPTKQGLMSVASLSGASGADFEGLAAVLRGAPEKSFLQIWLPFFFNERDFITFGEVLRYVVVKGNCCFVFTDKESHAPLYAIPLDEVTAFVEDPKYPDINSVTVSPVPGKIYKNDSKGTFATVMLKYRNDGSQAYQITFDTSNEPSVATRFVEIINVNSSTKEKAVTASVLKANDLGAHATNSQPSI